MRVPSSVFLAFGALTFLISFGSISARAADELTVEVTLQNDAFSPAEVKVPAGKAFVLKVINRDSGAAEIEAKELKIEKVVAGNSEIRARVRAQQPGRYLVVNEYKEDTVKAFVVVE